MDFRFTEFADAVLSIFDIENPGQSGEMLPMRNEFNDVQFAAHLVGHVGSLGKVFLQKRDILPRSESLPEF
jgi:hypothetical protein